jgi:hypothetical protein
MYWPVGIPCRYTYGHSHVLQEPSTEPEEGKVESSEVEEKSLPEVENEKSEHSQPLKAPESPASSEILDLRIARNGSMFATITRETLVLWQVRPTAVLTSVIRSKTSLDSYGPNIALYVRPDTSIIVVQTALGYLVTYSLAIEPTSGLYVTHIPFSGHRRKSSILGLTNERTDLRDATLRFRMVIKVDAGIQRALAMDEELVVATSKPAAIQSIRWTPDENKNQTKTELLSKLTWLPKKVSIVDMVYDRPMNLLIWIASDGSVYAVTTPKVHTEEGEKTTLHGFCFHAPTKEDEYAVKVAVNARFSLIAVALRSGETKVFAAKDYSGNIPLMLRLSPVISSTQSGPITSLGYSPDGHCLFIGYEKGWTMWSVFGHAGANSFIDNTHPESDGDRWLYGVRNFAWIGGGSQLLLLGPNDDTIWVLDVLRSAATACFSSANITRSLMQTDDSVYVYRGHDLENPVDLPAESSLWQVVPVPASYITSRWPLRYSAISSDGRYIAVAGKRGLAHYSIASGRWRLPESAAEDDFALRGGMVWYQHLLIAAVDTGSQYELRLYSRELPLANTSILHRELLASPVVLLSISGESSLLVYTHENILFHFIITTSPVGLVLVGQIGFNGIVRAPARVRAIQWILPRSQIEDGDPSMDVRVASVIFLVDGKLVLLQPHTTEADIKYELKVISQNVEFFMLMRDCGAEIGSSADDTPTSVPTSFDQPQRPPQDLEDSLWVFDGVEVKIWRSMAEATESLSAEGAELPAPITLPVDSYPLSVLLSKGLILGVESEISPRRNDNPSSMRISTKTSLFLPHILRSFTHAGNHHLAFLVSQGYEHLPYYSHALELLLHNVLDEEVDSPPTTGPSNLPAVLEFVSNSPHYLDIIVQCTRKTEMRSWKTLFSHLPPVGELFDESLRRDMLKTAGGYLLVLHTLDQQASDGDQTKRLLERAMAARDWDLCKELARFLAAIDSSGAVLRRSMEDVVI